MRNLSVKRIIYKMYRHWYINNNPYGYATGEDIPDPFSKFLKNDYKDPEKVSHYLFDELEFEVYEKEAVNYDREMLKEVYKFYFEEYHKTFKL